MHFFVLAYDGSDEKALERRMAAREAHLKSANELYNNGQWLYAAALLNEDGKMIGSTIICDFSSRKELEEEWLKNEPYILGNVWKKIEIHRAQIPSFILRSKE
jgi:uncharacterized protein